MPLRGLGHNHGIQRGPYHWPRPKYKTASGSMIRCEAHVPHTFCDNPGMKDGHDAEIRGSRHDLLGRK